jgi:hypothetical protein
MGTKKPTGTSGLSEADYIPPGTDSGYITPGSEARPAAPIAHNWSRDRLDPEDGTASTARLAVAGILIGVGIVCIVLAFVVSK